MSDAPKCPKCGELWKDHAGDSECLFPDKDKRIAELERELTKHHKASVKHVAELQFQRDAALKARDEAADQVVVLGERFEEYANCVNARIKAIQVETGSEWPWAAQEIMEAQLKDALQDTSALAAQRKLEIQKEALEAAWERVRVVMIDPPWRVDQRDVGDEIRDAILGEKEDM